jgi:hypothetical protein
MDKAIGRLARAAHRDKTLTAVRVFVQEHLSPANCLTYSHRKEADYSQSGTFAIVGETAGMPLLFCNTAWMKHYAGRDPTYPPTGAGLSSD